jgi:hypothetical protein
MKRSHLQLYKNKIEQQYNEFCVYKGTRSKMVDPQSLQELTDKPKETIWISATKTYNALMSNHLVDWLNIYGKSHDVSHTDQFMKFLCKRGDEFETMIVNNILKKTDVVKISNYYSKDAVKNTIKYMKEGTPVIWSASLSNKSNSTYGIADLLIRSDMFKMLFKTSPLTNEEEKIPAPKLSTPYHYRVVEVKYCSIPLASDNTHIVSSPKFNAYKGQLHIYNEAIAKIQGYKPPCSYIIGRRVVSSEFSSTDAFEHIGVVNFSTHDNFIINKTKCAIDWYRNVCKKGAGWKIDPPDRKELYPNMNVDSGKWNNVKSILAKKNGEITLLWKCGENHRNTMIETIENPSYNNELCCAALLGFNGVIRNTIDNIIEVNRNNSTQILPNKLETPEIAKNNSIEFFVDFETFTDICQDVGTSSQHTGFCMIFMIGVGWIKNGEWNHQTFIADSVGITGERNLINRFQAFIKDYQNPLTTTSEQKTSKLFYWAADEIMWKQALKRHNITNDYTIKQNWCNMANIFTNNSIAIKGSYSYKLKELASAMKLHGMIQTDLNADCSNGGMAMIRAWQCYSKYQIPASAPIMQDIVRYNHYDCKVMYDMLSYLRTNIFVDKNLL